MGSGSCNPHQGCRCIAHHWSMVRQHKSSRSAHSFSHRSLGGRYRSSCSQDPAGKKWEIIKIFVWTCFETQKGILKISKTDINASLGVPDDTNNSNLQCSFHHSCTGWHYIHWFQSHSWSLCTQVGMNKCSSLDQYWCMWHHSCRACDGCSSSGL